MSDQIERMARQPPRLQDLSPFASLERIGRDFSVQFLLYGGAATRAAMRLAYRPDQDFDLFDLSPFASDLDLVHTGEAKLTARISVAIADEVPFATWCRWSLIDWSKWQEVAANMRKGAQVPLRRIIFCTDGHTPWPLRAAHDLSHRRVSIRRTSRFGATSFARSGRSLEVFTLLMALNTVVEMREIGGEGALANQAAVERWLGSESVAADRAAIRERARLATRTWHLTATRLARAAGAESFADRWLREAGVLTALGANLPKIEDLSAFTVSKPTSTGEPRVSDLFPTVLTGEAGRVRALHILAEAAERSGAPPPRLDPAFDVVACAEALSVSGQASADVEDGEEAFGSLPSSEFLHLAWVPPPGDAHDEQLTAVLLPLSGPAAGAPPPPSAAVGGVFRSGRAWLRIDIEALVRPLQGRPAVNSDVALIGLAPHSNRRRA
jgi:hypothetical protein